MRTFPARWYTSPDNEIVAAQVIASTCRDALAVAEREQARFADLPEAASIDAVDAAYAAAGITFPDSLGRDRAIAAHHEGRPSFALRSSGPAQAALAILHAGGDLADHIVERARGNTSLPAKPFAELLAYEAGRILPGMVPINAAAERVMDEAIERLEALQAQSRPAMARAA